MNSNFSVCVCVYVRIQSDDMCRWIENDGEPAEQASEFTLSSHCPQLLVNVNICYDFYKLLRLKQKEMKEKKANKQLPSSRTFFFQFLFTLLAWVCVCVSLIGMVHNLVVFVVEFK